MNGEAASRISAKVSTRSDHDMELFQRDLVVLHDAGEGNCILDKDNIYI